MKTRIPPRENKPVAPFERIQTPITKEAPQGCFFCYWRMRRDLNPRYESPRIHDFESRAFSLSATHPLYIFLQNNPRIKTQSLRAHSGCRPLALNWLVTLVEQLLADLRFCSDSGLSATHPSFYWHSIKVFLFILQAFFYLFDKYTLLTAFRMTAPRFPFPLPAA